MNAGRGRARTRRPGVVPLALALALALVTHGARAQEGGAESDGEPEPARPAPAAAGPTAPVEPAALDEATDGLELLARAEQAMTTLDYVLSRELARRAIERGGLDRADLARALRLVAVASAQLGDDAAAEPAFVQLFAIDPESNIASRLAPERRSAVLDARGYWTVHKRGFGLDVSYVRREREVVVRVHDPLVWGRTLHVWTRFGQQEYVKQRRAVTQEEVFTVADLEPTEALEVYAFVTDSRQNVIMEFATAREPHVFALSEAELSAILRRDIRGGQAGSYGRRLEELDVQVGVHGYVSLEFKPIEGTPSFDVHHATGMIRANLYRAASLELAFEWEHLARDADDFYLPHAFIDVEVAEPLILRGGFFEVPVGAFNEYLYPDFLRITGLPPLFSRSVVPALWSEVGVEARGRVGLGRLTHFTYAVFVGNGLEQRDADPEDGSAEEGGDIRAMRFNVRDEFHGDKAIGGRLGLEIDEFDLGVSGYTGRYTIESDRRLNIADLDLSYRGAWLTVRAEGAVALQETQAETLRKYGLYTLVAARPIPHLEPYVQYDLVDVDEVLQRGLVGVALYPAPNRRATRNLRLKSEAGYEFTSDGERTFVWFFQLTTGF